jgi:hypothetical protein
MRLTSSTALRRFFVIAAVLFVTAASDATAQTYPGQYPPGQNPGQYPPGQYPPGQYPPGQYPGTGIQIPGIHLPSRKPKDSNNSNDPKVTVATVDGSLRKLSEKDLLLQTKQAILRFRLIAKTQFKNKAGDQIRDSLLHPGDQLTIFVSPDDPETALRVVLAREGTAIERAGGEQTVDEAQVRAPSSADLGKSTKMAMGGGSGSGGPPINNDTIGSGGGSSASSSDPGDRPSLKRDEGSEGGTATSAEPAAAAPTATRDANLMGDAEIIGEARNAAMSFSQGLPNFLTHQVTKRYFSGGFPPSWRQLDEVSAELAYLNGKEDYRDIRVDGQPALRPVESSGSWSTGDFGTTLDDVMSPGTNATFRRRGEERIGVRSAIVYNYTVDEANSHWTLVSPDGRKVNPAYEGAIWVDKETLRILRLEQRATSLPRGYPFTRAEYTLVYGWVRIDDKAYLMPASGENVGCMSGGTCNRNTTEFRDYRKFVADSKITY